MSGAAGRARRDALPDDARGAARARMLITHKSQGMAARRPGRRQEGTPCAGCRRCARPAESIYADHDVRIALPRS